MVELAGHDGERCKKCNYGNLCRDESRVDSSGTWYKCNRCGKKVFIPDNEPKGKK